MAKIISIPRFLAPLRQGILNQHQTDIVVELPPPVVLLRQWQASRLAQTHQDLLTSSQYGAACRFFLDDIYAPRDFSQRDSDLIRVYEAMRQVMPHAMAHTLIKVIELNRITIELDQHLLHILIGQLGLTDTLTETIYAEAYRRCQNYEKRRAQIDLIVDVGESVHHLVRLPFISLSLRLAHGPAHWTGWAELQTFLENGFAAFKKMEDVSFFLSCVAEREKQILENIYANKLQPFRLDDGRSANVA
jgi:hypothetical protein